MSGVTGGESPLLGNIIMRIIEILEASKPATNNLVAKHARTYNKATVQADRKKKAKKGYQKHKNKDNI